MGPFISQFMAKAIYKIRNWKEYNKSLVNRGSITLWFNEEAIDQWHKAKQTGSKGRPFLYSNKAIEVALTIRSLFKLPLRATEGLILSLAHRLSLPILVPTYTTLCRRQRTLSINLNYRARKNEPLHLVIDSSGIKIYGDGEWSALQHGANKKRSWRKLHIGVDVRTRDILVSKVTKAHTHDAKLLPYLLEQVKGKINQVTLDRQYDTANVYASILRKQAIPVIPPRRNARISSRQTPAWQARNKAIEDIHQKGLYHWQQQQHYHKRSLVENAFSRIKRLLGAQASNRRFDHQKTEMLLRCQLINRFNKLGQPDSYVVR